MLLILQYITGRESGAELPFHLSLQSAHSKWEMLWSNVCYFTCMNEHLKCAEEFKHLCHGISYSQHLHLGISYLHSCIPHNIWSYHPWLHCIVELSLGPRPKPTSVQIAFSIAWSNICARWEWCPYKGKGVVSTPVGANKVSNGPASANQSCSTASQVRCHVHSTPCWNPHSMSWIYAPASTYPTSLLVQNLSSKLITSGQS